MPGRIPNQAHVWADGKERPMLFSLRTGQRHKTQAFDALITIRGIARAHLPEALRRLSNAIVETMLEPISELAHEDESAGEMEES
jgi:hypothetical protein